MTTEIPMFWWRVETDAHDAVISCERVDSEKEGSARVVYVRAKSRREAERLAAREWHERHKRYQKVSAKRLAAKRRAAGQCRKCPEPICEESMNLCKPHLVQHREANRRHRRGEAKKRVPADSGALKAAHNAAHRLFARLGEQLPELLAKYDELDGEPSVFREWLEREISVREVAPLRLVGGG